MQDHIIFCVARQFGSGGREVGRMVAKELQIPFYDKEILREAANKSGILEELFEKHDEKAASGFKAPFMPGSGKAASFADYMAYAPDDRIQEAVAGVIRDAADTGSCVIIGRCADYVLRGRPGAVSVFVHAALEVRIKRVSRLHNLDEDAARNLIRKTDHNRANYYSYYTDREWGDADNYHLSLDAGRLGIANTAEIVKFAAPLYLPK